ncbi:MAG: phosphatase PAP2 family protein [Bacteroidales bacterium]
MKQKIYNLSPVWFSLLTYLFITLILILIFDAGYLLTSTFIISRAIVVIFLVARLFNNSLIFKKYGEFADVIFIYVLLAFFYGETARFNTYFLRPIDDVLSKFDSLIFGFQPSLVFSEKFNSTLFSELMFFGYFAYYIIPFAAFYYVWKNFRLQFQSFSFIVITSFFIYYLVFIIVPAVGPQFYFPWPLNHIEAKGPFGYLIKLIHKYGEAPTAAFPSSHVGIISILLILIIKINRLLFIVILPFCILLFFSTVYIKAHYFVDVLAGLASSVLILRLSEVLFLNTKILTKNLTYVNRD